MAGVQGLTGLQPSTTPGTGYPSYYTEGWVDPYAEYASPADSLGVDQYTWEAPPPMPWLLAQDANGWVPPPVPVMGAEPVPGNLGAETDPSLYSAPIETGSHNAPFPAFGVNDSVPFNTDWNNQQLMESYAIHASDTGQDQAFLDGPEPANPWHRQDVTYSTAGEALLSDVPDQLKGNMAGSRGGQHGDHVQGFEWGQQQVPEDGEGFVRMPSAHSDVAGNWMWLDPALRPVEVRPTGYRDWPVGEMSPFTGQIPGTHGLGDIQGAVIDYAPPEYVPPAEPAVAQPLNADNAVWSAW